jgi:hypothetical protein
VTRWRGVVATRPVTVMRSDIFGSLTVDGMAPTRALVPGSRAGARVEYVGTVLRAEEAGSRL